MGWGNPKMQRAVRTSLREKRKSTHTSRTSHTGCRGRWAGEKRQLRQRGQLFWPLTATAVWGIPSGVIGAACCLCCLCCLSSLKKLRVVVSQFCGAAAGLYGDPGEMSHGLGRICGGSSETSHGLGHFSRPRTPTFLVPPYPRAPAPPKNTYSRILERGQVRVQCGLQVWVES